jgi:hypothetical protein
VVAKIKPYKPNKKSSPTNQTRSRVGWSLAVDSTGHTLAVLVDEFRLELIDRASGPRQQISPDGLDATMRAVGFSTWNSDIISGDEKDHCRTN